jgi:ABC-type multidrug transport system ATPase subunit
MSGEEVAAETSGQVTKMRSMRSKDERVVITWHNITFQTVLKDPSKSTFLNTAYKTKNILNGLNGRAASGELLAILGPTGCGKTSLLNVLAARIPLGGSSANKLTGTIMFNGKPRQDEKFRNISAYVLQDDYMYAFLTLFETLMLAAHFFLPMNFTEDEKRAQVEACIAELGLVKARDTIIGNDKVRGVSGGERRRASIAVQLLTDPAVLFLDEPTSGLDAFQSQAVMEAMKNLAVSGRLVMTVIHQPRSSIYEMFDKLLVLSEGRTMFYGDAKDAVDHFSAHNYACPPSFNPSDFFLDLLSPDNRSPEIQQETKNRIAYLGDVWEKVPANTKLIDDGATVEEFASVKIIGADSGSIGKTLKAFQLLCWRCWVEQARNKGAIMVKFLTAIIFSLLIGGIYSKNDNSQKSIQNMKGVLFFILINQSFTTILAVLNSFPREKLIVNRERSGRAYNTLAYCMAKFFVEQPFNLTPIVVYSLIVHKLANMNSNTLGQFIGICLFANATGLALGLAISAFAPSVEAASAVGPVFIIIGILFGGFYIKISSLPIILNWIPFISLFRWAYEALCINEFQGRTFSCNTNPSQCLTTGEEVLQTLSYSGHTVNYPIFGLGMLLLCYLAGLYVLLLLNKLRYMPLGFVGSAFKKRATDVPITQPQPYEMVAVSSDDGGANTKGIELQKVTSEDGQDRSVLCGIPSC